MKSEKEIKEFYDKLKQQLAETSTWPALYLYKFIVPSSLEKIAEIEKVFDNTNAVFATRDSSKGKYSSVTIKVTMKSPDEVVEKYMEVSKVEGVISL
ncbi:MAG: DUF493 family protein [Flavobacteriaceae bacterium]